MRILIQWLSEVTPTPLEVESSDTIHTVLAKFEKESGLKTEGRVLRLDETELQDDQSLADYNIEEGTTLRFFEKYVPSRCDKRAIIDTAAQASIIRTSLSKTDREESDPKFKVGKCCEIASVVYTFLCLTGSCGGRMVQMAEVVRASPDLTGRDESDSEDEGRKRCKRCFLCFSC